MQVTCSLGQVLWYGSLPCSAVAAKHCLEHQWWLLCSLLCRIPMLRFLTMPVPGHDCFLMGYTATEDFGPDPPGGPSLGGHWHWSCSFLKEHLAGLALHSSNTRCWDSYVSPCQKVVVSKDIILIINRVQGHPRMLNVSSFCLCGYK